MVVLNNKYGVCSSHSNKYPVLDDIGCHFLDHAVELVKARKQFVYVVNNIDRVEKVHDIRSPHQNKRLHAVTTSMVFSRVSSEHLSDDGPQNDVKTYDFRELVDMSNEEMIMIRDRYQVFVVRVLLEKFPIFAYARSDLSVKTEYEYVDSVGEKSGGNHIACFN